MSRHGYSDDLTDWALIRWRGQVASAIRGRRGQALLIQLRDALDAMPEKALIASELVTEDGDVCALGCAAVARGIDLTDCDPGDTEYLAETLDVAVQLIREIAYENDEGGWKETSEERWSRMRRWVEHHIKQSA